MNIETFNPIKDIRETKQLAKVYAQVFGADPWLEVTRCPGEKKFFGQETKPGEKCGCGSILDEAYPEDDTIQYILDDSQKASALVLVAKDGSQIVGFSWAYVVENARAFTEEKYREQALKRQIEDTLVRSGVWGRLYYFSETGLLPNYRGNGTTNDFYRQRLEVAEELGLPSLVRTRWDSPIVAAAQKFEFRQVMGPEVLVQNREIVKTGPIVNGLLDSENPERVLFVKRPRRYEEIVDRSLGCLR